MTPIVNGLESEYGDSIAFIYLDANEPVNASIQSDLDLRGHPSAAVINADGEVLTRYFGVQPAEQIVPVLDTILETGP